MPDDSKLLFEVVCKGCRRTLVTVDRIRDPEIAVVTDHLRACSPSEPLGDAPMRGDGPRSSRGSGAGVGGTRRMPDKSKYDFPLRSAAKALGVSPSSYLRLVGAQAAEPRSVSYV